MASTLRRAASLLAPAAAIGMALAASPAASAATAGPSWQLVNLYTSGSPACFTPGGGSQYLQLRLNGSWSTDMTFGVSSGLPSGGSFSDVVDENIGEVWSQAADAIIPPGSDDGSGVISLGPYDYPKPYQAEAYLLISIPAGLAATSTFNVTVWASDGTTEQSETMSLVIEKSCSPSY